MRYPEARLLLMAKAPVAGLAKTRLIPAIGAEGAAKLQGYLIERQLQQTLRAELAPLALWCAGECEHPFFQRVGQLYPISLHCQQGGDLGARIAHALRSALRSAPYAIVFGSDIPELYAEVLERACQVMAQGADAVVVPAEDGGYALLGLRVVPPALFTGIDWGSERVMAQTRERLQQLGWHWEELTPLWDLDRPEDLERLAKLKELPPWLRERLACASGQCHDHGGIEHEQQGEGA